MANAVRSTLLQRIANYFTEWDGDDRTAPVMQLNIHELRDIASMHVELCRLLEDKKKHSSEARELERIRRIKMTGQNHSPHISNNPIKHRESLWIEIADDRPTYLMFPLIDYTIRERVSVFQKETLRKFFERIDDSAHNFLGINRITNDEELNSEVSRLLEKEKDLQHKYYLIQTHLGDPVAIFYVYGYQQKWGKTKIGFGLLPEYRGQGLAMPLLKPIIESLENENGICRIEGEIETKNIASLHLGQRLMRDFGFEFEGVRKNNWGKGVDCRIYARCTPFEEDSDNVAVSDYWEEN